MNTPVNFEISKVLKEKGFNEPCDSWYYDDGSYHDNPTEWINSKLAETNYSRPTIAEVVMWLYEKHEIWIEVSCHTVLDEKDDDIDVDVFYSIIRELKPVNALYSGDFVNSPTEAYSQAIEYTLKNLI